MSRERTAAAESAAGHPAGEAVPVAALYAVLERELLGARGALGDPAARLASIDRAEALVYRLHGALDLRGGGELARRLAGLYGYVGTELQALRRAPDGARVDELLELAATLRQAAGEGR